MSSYSTILLTVMLIFMPMIQTQWITILSDVKKTETKTEAKDGGTITIVNGKTDDLREQRSGPWLHTVRNQTGRIMEGGTDLVLTPLNWLTNMTSYWPLYLVCLTIILCLLAFFYCKFKDCIEQHLIRRQSTPLPFTNFFSK